MILRRVPKSVAVAAVVAVGGNLLAVAPAYALFGVADTGDGVLAAILAQGTEALATAKNTLTELNQVREFGQKAFTTAKDTYELAKHSAQMVESGIILARSVRDFSASRFGTAFTEDLEAAFPDVAYWRREAENPLGLGQGYDRSTANAMKYCLADYVTEHDACQRLKGKNDKEKVDAMVALTFGIRPSSEQPPPTTQAQLIEQTCDDRYLAAMEHIEAERKVIAKTAAAFSELRETCEHGPRPGGSAAGQRTYGVFQGLANDAERVRGDLASLGNGSGAADEKGAATDRAKLQAEACAEFHRQEDMVAKETEKYSRLTDLEIKGLELCKMGEERAREKVQGGIMRAEAEALRRNGSRVRSRLSAGSGPKVTAGDGYNIVSEGR